MGGCVSSLLYKELVTGQPGLSYRETLSQKNHTHKHKMNEEEEEEKEEGEEEKEEGGGGGGKPMDALEKISSCQRLGLGRMGEYRRFLGL